ncbi:hypothetical protein DPMN_182509 [Dreissena polymorpha]|uniref:Uncharacterized protein n=1 Tax=Dreissena polymorpha TaxID=45954 RepID=A0A9D4DHA4_DREPO|nr:hypothetical protein DPMN_182509 [Dreissena polymorpha]
MCNADDRFRSINGTCNNLNNPTWGMAGAAQRRLLPAAYGEEKINTLIPRRCMIYLHW